MRRISVFVTIALLAGFASGYFARSAADILQRSDLFRFLSVFQSLSDWYRNTGQGQSSSDGISNWTRRFVLGDHTLLSQGQVLAASVRILSAVPSK
jgi:hypothetical protein